MSSSPMTDYEMARRKNIEEREAMFRQLGLADAVEACLNDRSEAPPPRSEPSEPTEQVFDPTGAPS